MIHFGCHSSGSLGIQSKFSPGLPTLAFLILLALFPLPRLGGAHPPIPPYTPHLNLPRWVNIAGEISGADPTFLFAVAWVESRHSHKAKGDFHKGKYMARGLWQMHKSACPLRPCRNWMLHDKLISSVAAGLLWRRLIKRYGRTRAAVIYNCGPRRCGKAKHTRTTRKYFRRFEYYELGKPPR